MIDVRIRPSWRAGHLARLHHKIGLGLQQDEIAGGLEIIEQVGLGPQMGVADAGGVGTGRAGTACAALLEDYGRSRR